MSPYNYVFPAIRGIQAKREYYVAMCPLKLVPKILIFNETNMKAQFKAQRVLNKSRIPSLVRYIIDNPSNYVFSALTASVDTEIEFSPIEGLEDQNIGQLSVPMTANMLVNDGQHRRAAIEKALQLRPELGDETIPIVLFLDAGLKRSQQMFADLNRYAVRPARSLNILYDYRDPLSALVRKIIQRIHVFDDMVELGKTSISNRSTKLFTLSCLHQATQELLNGHDISDKNTAELAISFWSEIAKVIPDWERAKNNEVSGAHLRKHYIHAHGVTLHALGIMGAALVKQYSKNWKTKLKQLRKIKWERSNAKLWEGRAMIAGRLSKANNHVRLTANVLKKTVGVRLTKDERVLEKRFTQGELRD